MKIKLIKERKLNGDIFYYLEEDDSYVRDSIVYGGNYESTADKLLNKYNEAILKYNNYLIQRKQVSKEVIAEKEIIND